MNPGLHRTEDHVYYFTDEHGRTHMPEGAPSVTTVLKQVDKSGAFWAAASRIVAEAAIDNHELVASMLESQGRGPAVDWLKATSRARTDKARDLGTIFHQRAEDHANGQEILFEGPEAPYVHQFFTGFIEKYRPTFEHVEEMVYSFKGRYGGTFDVIAKFGCGENCRTATPEGCRWLIDYKTSDKRIGKGMTQFPYPDTGLQLAALGFADFIGRPDDPTRHPIPPIDHFGVVAVTPEDCQLVRYDVQEADFQTFLHYRNVHEWMTTRRKGIKA